MRNWDAVHLDPTGNTIPPTYHSPDDPDEAVFMATNGDDKNDGRSDMSPVKTLNRAIQVAPNNGTVCFRGGTYNDNYKNADGTYKILSDKFLTFTSYLGEPVCFDGANRLHHLLVCGSSNGIGCHSIKGFEVKGFVGDWGGSIGEVPFYLGDGEGAWYAVEDMLIHKNSGVGLNMSDPRGDLGPCRLNRNVVCDNGSNGFTDTGNMKITKGKYPSAQHENNLWVINNYLGRNNLNNNQHPYEAGMKAHNNNKIMFMGNIVEDIFGNYGHALWTDVANIDSWYVMNFVRRCGSSGPFDEVGQRGRFVSNIVVDCGYETNQANIRIASEYPEVWYNTSVITGKMVNGKKAYIPIEIYDDVRNIQSDGYGPDTRGANMSSNMFSGGLGKYPFLMYLYANGPAHAGGGTVPSQFFNYWGTNAWDLNGGQMVRWAEGGKDSRYRTPAELQAARGVGGRDILVDNPFQDTVSWRIKANSPAHQLADPLPAEIAGVLGYQTGSRFPYGYIDCPIPSWA